MIWVEICHLPRHIEDGRNPERLQFGEVTSIAFAALQRRWASCLLTLVATTTYEIKEGKNFGTMVGEVGFDVASQHECTTVPVTALDAVKHVQVDVLVPVGLLDFLNDADVNPLDCRRPQLRPRR